MKGSRLFPQRILLFIDDARLCQAPLDRRSIVGFYHYAAVCRDRKIWSRDMSCECALNDVCIAEGQDDDAWKLEILPKSVPFVEGNLIVVVVGFVFDGVGTTCEHSCAYRLPKRQLHIKNQKKKKG